MDACAVGGKGNGSGGERYSIVVSKQTRMKINVSKSFIQRTLGNQFLKSIVGKAKQQTYSKFHIKISLHPHLQSQQGPPPLPQSESDSTITSPPLSKCSEVGSFLTKGSSFTKGLKSVSSSELSTTVTLSSISSALVQLCILPG